MYYVILTQYDEAALTYLHLIGLYNKFPLQTYGQYYNMNTLYWSIIMITFRCNFLFYFLFFVTKLTKYPFIVVACSVHLDPFKLDHNFNFLLAASDLNEAHLN